MITKETSIWEAPTAVLDFETTGLSVEAGDRVVEVAIVRAEGLDDPNPEYYTELVYPEMEVPPSAWAIHGIDDNMLVAAPAFGEVIDSIERLLSGAVFVAHNAPFDRAFLERESWRLGREAPVIPFTVDTLPMARRLFGLPQCGLGALAQRMAIPLNNPHRALADATATFGIYRSMLAEIDPHREMNIGDLNEHIESMRRNGDGRSQFSRMLHSAARSGDKVEIDYTRIAGPGSLTVRRQITVQSFRPPIVDAWCHLREQPRVFRLDRIQRVQMVEAH